MAMAYRKALAGLGVTAVVCTGTSATPAQAAAAGTAEVSGSTVVFTARQGRANTVVVTRRGGTVTIDDRYAIRAGRRCAAVRGDRTRVRCATGTAVSFLRFSLGDRADRVVNRTTLPMDADGGTGNDTLLGGAGRDSLTGGKGNDRLVGGPGADFLHDGAGNDTVDAGPGDDTIGADAGADVLRGGTGRDQVLYDERDRPVYVDLDGARRDDGERGEHDSVGSDVEDVEGGRGADVLIGNARGNLILGRGGNDVILGGAGADTLVGGLAADRINGDAGDDLIFAEPRPEWSPEFAGPARLAGPAPLAGATGIGLVVGPSFPEENPGSDAARDRVDGGGNTAAGDACYIRAAGVAVRCERVPAA